MDDIGCAPWIEILLAWLFFLGFWSTIESNQHKRLLRNSDKFETSIIREASPSEHLERVFDGERMVWSNTTIWTYSLDNSARFTERNKKTFSEGDTLKRFYYVNHKNDTIYSDYVSVSTNEYKYNSFWERSIFILYILFFLILTFAMYRIYSKKHLKEYKDRLSEINNANIVDKVHVFLSQNKLIILVTSLSSGLLFLSLRFYFIKTPQVSINPAHLILYLTIFSFLIPIVFIVIFITKDNVYVRSPLKLIQIAVIISSIFYFIYNLIQLIELGRYDKTSIAKLLEWVWEIFKDI